MRVSSAALIALAAGLALAPSARAGELLAMQGASVTLGPDQGSVYYTVAADGFRVVATLAPAPAVPPVRFIATLQPGQSVTLSVGRAAGEPPAEVLIRRVGDRVVYDNGIDQALPTD